MPAADMRIVVVGGGISGLACAWRLHQQGAPVLLLEQEETCGGVIRSVRREEVLFEAGPQSILLTAPLLDLVRSVQLEEELLRADPRAPRYVLQRGKLVAAPLSPTALITSPLLSAATKWRLFSEPFRRSQPPDGDESMADFVLRKFGAELLERLVGPMVSGIYAGDPQRLSLRSAFPQAHEWELKYGSVLRGAMKSRPAKGAPRPVLATFRRGNASLPSRLAERLAAGASTRTRVRGLRHHRSNGSAAIELDCEIAGRTETISAAAVVLAAPAGAAANLLAGLAPGAAELEGIEYAPVCVVAGAYSTEHLRGPLDGFGFLVPRSEGFRVLGTVWNSALFPGRVPEGTTLLTSFIGGATDPSAGALPEEALFQAVETELRRILGITFAPRVRFTQRWTRALPQYTLGHGQRLAAVRAALERVPGVFLTGNYLAGPSVGACVEHASQVAQQVYEYWRTTK